MKSLILATGLFAATATSIAYYDDLVAATRHVSPPATAVTTQPVAPAVDPAVDPAVSTIDAAMHSPRIDLVFALDTTGSMSGMIEAAKEKIWSIASTMANAQTAPQIRVGLVAYRDRGDAYVTRVVDLTDDLDTMYATLMQFQAGGGGDGPESVNQALHEAVTKMSWTDGQDAYKVIFLVGDAPAHMDYKNDVPYPESVRLAAKKGIVVNTIQCGSSRSTRNNWQQIARLSQGNYFQVGQSGSAVAVATPYDEQLADLSTELEKTRLTYGSAKEREAVETRREKIGRSISTASASSRARRAAFNASDSGKANLLGKKDLIEDVERGVVELDGIDKASLPEELRALPAPQAAAVVKEKAGQRQNIQKQIQALSKQRQDFIKRELAAKGGARDSLDAKIFSTVKEQAADKGLRYSEDAARY